MFPKYNFISVLNFIINIVKAIVLAERGDLEGLRAMLDA